MCPYCRDAFGDELLQICSSCRTTMHKECFEENKGCATLGCGKRAKTWPCCPKCQEQLKSQGAVVCVTCGFHIEKGEFLEAAGSGLGGVRWDVDHSPLSSRKTSWGRVFLSVGAWSLVALFIALSLSLDDKNARKGMRLAGIGLAVLIITVDPREY